MSKLIRRYFVPFALIPPLVFAASDDDLASPQTVNADYKKEVQGLLDPETTPQASALAPISEMSSKPEKDPLALQKKITSDLKKGAQASRSAGYADDFSSQNKIEAEYKKQFEDIEEAEEVKRGVVSYRDFFYPKYQGLALSYCLKDDKTCGMTVASQYCRTLGYDKALEFMREHNVGLTSYLDTDLQCQGWKCDGFKLIVCEESLKKKPTPVYYYSYRDFVLPRFENYRVAWCYKDKRGCGKRAANAFCRQQGYRRAKGYERAQNLPATRTIGSGELCYQTGCTGFNRITCYR